MIAVTGSTGALGSRVAARLAGYGVAQRLIVRDAARAASLDGAEIAVAAGYDDVAAMTAAMLGCDTLLFVSARESANRVAEHLAVVEAAHAAGIERIVYTSFINASATSTFTLGRDHFATERAIRASGIAFTFLQDNLYVDFIPFMASAQGVIAGPAGDGRLAAVARDDVADAAVAVLRDAAHAGRTYRLTGPESFSLAVAAAELARATDRTVIYKAETLEQAYASRASYNAPKFEVDGWVTSYVAIANGDLAEVTNDIPDLLGRKAIGLPEFLKRNPETTAHLRT